LVSVTPSTGGADWLPASFSTGGNTLNFTYTSSLAVASVTGTNGETSTAQYDDDRRITQSTSPDGAVTNYTYTFYPSANTAKATTGSRWKRTTTDGLGRTVKEENGHDAVTVPIVDTEYVLCACSATGKVWRVSQPYAPNATVYWTTYTYDALGRTLTSTAPDGSVTSYLYQGNNTTVTDPTGKWKKFTSDAFGNLTLVTEPGNVVTSYSYDTKSRLINVSMTRDTGTQTRTFTYNANLLVSTTQPENGQTQYTYNEYGYLTRITKNNGSQIDYTYDGSGRRTSMTTGGNTVTWYYDGNPFDPYISTYAGGRLAAVDYGQGNVMREMYGYNQAGRVTAQRLVVGQVNYDATAGYEYDNEGRLTAIQYPVDAVEEGYTPVKLHYSYDAMGRPNLLKGDFPNNYPDWQLATAQYGAAGELTQMAWNGGPQTNGVSETRSYNPLRQLVRQTTLNWMGQTAWDMEYRYTAGQNNGRITSQKEYVSGEEVTYTYDALQRLIRAETTGPQWGQAYGYDGFGNLTSKTVTKGSGPTLSVAYNAATNHQIGGSYDGNGNWTGDSQSYDALGRATVLYEVAGGQMTWQYNPSNKRVLKMNQWFGGCQGQWPVELNFYAPWGKRLVRYKYNVACYNGEVSIGRQFPGETYYFAGRTIVEGRTMQGVSGPLLTDRLGSVQGQNGQGPGYKPYGEGGQNGGGEAFGTYQRDFEGQDWADQRYYTSMTGRFWSPDPYQAAAKGANDPANPQSWNRYAYVLGDPVNFRDPRGLFMLAGGGGGDDEDEDEDFDMSDGSGADGGSGPGGTSTISTTGAGPSRISGFLQTGALNSIDSARNAITTKGNCWKLLGFDSGTAAQRWFDNTITFFEAHLGKLQVRNGAPAGGTPPSARTSTFGAVYLNMGYNWNDFPKNPTSRGTTYNFLANQIKQIGRQMTSAQYGTLVVIHELEHNRPSDAQETPENRQDIYDKCIK
jgi:RHS repeat-associated protein